MSIRDKTRKKLWAKSGNRCAICKHELVGYQSEHATEVIIVEECHLVSPRPLRPRYDPELMIGYDDYNNLILLCRNHHKIIDEQVEIYTAGRLLLLKIIHETWVKKILNEVINSCENEPTKIHRIATGKELVEIIDSVH